MKKGGRGSKILFLFLPYSSFISILEQSLMISAGALLKRYLMISTLALMEKYL